MRPSVGLLAERDRLPRANDIFVETVWGLGLPLLRFLRSLLQAMMLVVRHCDFERVLVMVSSSDSASPNGACAPGILAFFPLLGP